MTANERLRSQGSNPLPSEMITRLAEQMEAAAIPAEEHLPVKCKKTYRCHSPAWTLLESRDGKNTYLWHNCLWEEIPLP